MTPDPLDALGDGGQHTLSAHQLLGALALISDLDPVIADVLRNLHLRVYPINRDTGAATDYIVLDLHGVSIGALRRQHDFYLHADTTETNDRIIAFEVNGLGEHDHPTR
ncbi:hypothetical protein GCM10020358_58120 [Amorphoplanes nipponensis]|uniref:Uncharacterized protein n=1 Tax=Actinoplanes nipponensis TaxID=135950 RepID=A0A919JNM1_9ACTN|nr:hypothetical protein [Actinoplanes nipponensis]GIE52515.1 hypothetical protein Ani05nite_60490 [Actinoplanes nipponensis]